MPFVAASLLMVAAIVAGWEGMTLWKSHADGVDSWSLEVHHAAVEIADTLSLSVRTTDEELMAHLAPAAEDMLVRRGGVDDFSRHVARSTEHLKQIAFIALFGTAGDLLFATDPLLKRQHVTARDRDFLRYFVDGGQGRHVTASLLSGPAILPSSPMWILVTRRLSQANGDLAGVIVAGIAPSYILQALVDPSLYLDKDVRIFLDSGRLLAVGQDDADRIGENFGEHSLFRDIAAGHLPQWGVLPDPFEDSPEIAALQRADDLPFLVSVTTDSGPELEDWWYRIAFLLGYAGVSIVGVAIFLLKGLWTHDDTDWNQSQDAGKD
ncbi:hypothetical protein [Telmatospirillum sp.]|uniref:PDC sensor domain-containing protein n=1 Tax=Telmatospirillum sp. TaxID=2079197 RepID=UPI00283DA349|nr:hypothetical protein [Telmatospirillum sp.]MDR3440901.1 hypothetical protein [Telmatospirillum sp.]